MADDVIEPPLPEIDAAPGAEVDDDFETLPSSGAIDPRDTPIGSAPPAADGPPAPEWAKGPKPAAPTDAKPGAQLPGTDKTVASTAGRTLAARRQEIQDEINALTAAKHTTRREVEETRAEIAQLRAEAAALRRPAGSPPTPATEPAAPAGGAAFTVQKPTLDQFPDYEQFTEALADWTAQRAEHRLRAQLAEERTAERQTQQQAFQQQAEQQTLAAHYARVAEFRASHPDYDTLVTAAVNLPINPMMEAHVLRSDTGPALMHYLASHPDECQRIASLPPGPTLVALGRLEASLDAAVPPPGPSKAPVRTHARPPIKPVGGGPASVVDEPPGDDADLDAHAAYYDRKDREARRPR